MRKKVSPGRPKVGRAQKQDPKPKRGGKGSRQKGDRFERECVHALLEGGIFAERVPLSGSAGGSFSADIEVAVAGSKRKFECKMRKRAWADLYAWLDGNYGLFIRCNQKPTLVILPLETFIELHGEKF